MRRSALLLAALPLMLGLAACSKDAASGETPSGAPIAKVAPPVGKAWTEVVSKTEEGGYLMGNPDAPIKLIEYGSLSCPACAKFAQDGFAKLTGEYVASGRVSFEFRSFAIHPQDVPLTILAGCGAPESFIPLAENLYTNFEAVSASTQQGIEGAQRAMSLPDNQRFIAVSEAMGFLDFFAARGLAKDQAKICLADISRATDFAKRTEAYGKDGVSQTPTLVLNDVKLPGASWGEIEAALQRAGARDK